MDVTPATTQSPWSTETIKVEAAEQGGWAEFETANPEQGRDNGDESWATFSPINWLEQTGSSDDAK